MNGEELLCISSNGKRVFFNPITSHTATHFEDTPTLRTLAIELLSKMSLKGNLIAKDVDMGRVIGENNVVKIDRTDDIIYAIRKNREDQGHVPFTTSRSSQPCSFISIYLVKKTNQSYDLSSIWIGRFGSPSFPQMTNATQDSIPFWSKHAFVWGSQQIIPGTELSDCPW